jgi:hypothetical protein
MLAQQNTAAIGFGKKSSQKAAQRELNRHIDAQADSIAEARL